MVFVLHLNCYLDCFPERLIVALASESLVELERERVHLDYFHISED